MQDIHPVIEQERAVEGIGIDEDTRYGYEKKGKGVSSEKRRFDPIITRVFPRIHIVKRFLSSVDLFPHNLKNIMVLPSCKQVLKGLKLASVPSLW
jgi:hypothetical protein